MHTRLAPSRLAMPTSGKQDTRRRGHQTVRQIEEQCVLVMMEEGEEAGDNMVSRWVL